MYALTAKAMKYVDEYTIAAGIQSAVLMENAAKGAVDEITKRFPDKSAEFLVVCSSGNNGGDAVCVARWLLHLGYSVNVYFIGTLENASEEFARQVKILAKAYPDVQIAGLRGDSDLEVIRKEYASIIDGIFGIGLNKKI